ncbi:cupin domain-containing protein [Brevibacterium marinum]
MAEHDQVNNLGELTADLLDKARSAHSGRAARTVYSGQYLKQTLLTFTAGSTMDEHESPPEATLQMIQGSVTLSSTAESWDLGTGDLMTVPPERHSVAIQEDSAFLLTTRIDLS